MNIVKTKEVSVTNVRSTYGTINVGDVIEFPEKGEIRFAKRGNKTYMTVRRNGRLEWLLIDMPTLMKYLSGNTITYK